MNHKFSNIFDEAGFGDYDMLYHEVQFKKLFELTINECAAVVQDLVDRRIPASEYPKRLKEYFQE